MFNYLTKVINDVSIHRRDRTVTVNVNNTHTHTPFYGRYLIADEIKLKFMRTLRNLQFYNVAKS